MLLILEYSQLNLKTTFKENFWFNFVLGLCRK